MSSMTAAFEEEGYSWFRVNHLTGFNLETRHGTRALRQVLKSTPTKLAWVSLPCTRLSSLQNLTPRDEEAWGRFFMATGGDVAWEWPTGASSGWRSKIKFNDWRSSSRSMERASTTSELMDAPMAWNGWDFQFGSDGPF